MSLSNRKKLIDLSTRGGVVVAIVRRGAFGKPRPLLAALSRLGEKIRSYPGSDCDDNGNLDVCDIVDDPGSDCDSSGTLDSCDLADGGPDCNENGVLDSCDIANGTSDDDNGDGIPDECQDPQFKRGDSNDDGLVNLADGIFNLTWTFAAGPAPGCLDAGDFNNDGTNDVSDPIFLFTWMFAGGPQPPLPYPDCGTDSTADLLDCVVYVSCP